MPVVNVISAMSQGTGAQQSYRRLEQGLSGGLGISGPGEGGPAAIPGAPAGDLKPGFLDIVRGFVGDVNDLQASKDQAIDAFAAGEVADVHQVMVAVEEAGLALDLLLEIRNRTLEAFQEIMRLQV